VEECVDDGHTHDDFYPEANDHTYQPTYQHVEEVDVCGCGDSLDHYPDGHSPVPMGGERYRTIEAGHPVEVEG